MLAEDWPKSHGMTNLFKDYGEQKYRNITDRTHVIITSSWFETAPDYKPRILDPKFEEFPSLEHETLCNINRSEKRGKNIQTAGYNGAPMVHKQVGQFLTIELLLKCCTATFKAAEAESTFFSKLISINVLLIFLVKLIVLGREGILKPHRCGPLNKCTLELANFFFLSCITFLLLLLPLSLLLHWLILALSSATSKSSTLFHLRTNDNRYEKLYTANIYTFIDTTFCCVQVFYCSSSTS